jgi:hypothetical protein
MNIKIHIYFLRFFLKKPFLYIFILALMLRLGAFVLSEPFNSTYAERLLWSGDPFEYATLARSLYERGAFSITWPEAMPNAFRTPGYPLIIMLFSQGNINLIWVVVLIQVLFDSIFALIFAYIIKLCFASRRIALVSGFLYSVYPEAIFWSTQLFPENVGLWFAVIGVGFLAASLQTRVNNLARFKILRLLGCLLIGFTVLIKPNWLLLPPLVAVWILFQFYNTKFAGRFLNLFACITLLGLPTFSWMAWNKTQWGNWTINYGQTAFKESLSSSILNKNDSEMIPVSLLWSREMKLHALIPDFSQPNYLPKSHLNVYDWSSNSLYQDKAITDAQFKLVVFDNFTDYVKVHIQGLIYLLASPGSNFIIKAYGLSDYTTQSHANFASSESNLLELARTKLLVSDNAIIRSFITAIVLSFVALVFATSLTQIFFEIRAHRIFVAGGPWVAYLIFSILVILIIGAGGTFRYRYALLVSLMPYASLFICSCAKFIINDPLNKNPK